MKDSRVLLRYIRKSFSNSQRSSENYCKYSIEFLIKIIFLFSSRPQIPRRKQSQQKHSLKRKFILTCRKKFRDCRKSASIGKFKKL